MNSAIHHNVGYALVERALYSLIVVVFAIGMYSKTCFASQNINVAVNANIQSLVNQYPPGTSFSLSPGIHRLQTIMPKDGDAFVGQSGAVLSGAIQLTSFVRSGSYWTAKVSNVRKAASYIGQCGKNHPACMYPEDLFYNNVPQTRVAALSSVSPGRWFLNYSTETVYMADNPSGQTVEISEIPYAFTGPGNSVVISNLTIEKYACAAQQGAVNGAGGGQWWTVQNNRIRLNHGRGISTGNGMYIVNNNVYSNGQMGIGGSGDSMTIQGNQISYNNYAQYDYYWEAGGLKIADARNVMIDYNYSHNNAGPGFWNDIESEFITYTQNQASGNIEAGIVSEISSNITISNNHIWDDGYNPDGTGLWWGAGILVENSSNVSIYSNYVSNCMSGIGGILTNRGNGSNGQPYLLENVTVISNSITQPSGTAAGIVVEGRGFDDSVFKWWNNLFQNNTYILGDPSAKCFQWLGQALSSNTFKTLLGI